MTMPDPSGTVAVGRGGETPDPRFELADDEIRVLGSLVEKQLTTPQQYPLSLNALMLACNQSSNRDPVVAYDEATVEAAVRRAKQRGLVRFVHPSHGRSVLRYEHLLGDALGIDRAQLALLTVLMLRGAQTVGELRSRTDRMVEFEGLAGVVHDLELLAGATIPLVVRLPRRPGQKEDRFAQCLGAGPEEVGAGAGPEEAGAGAGPEEAGAGGGPAHADGAPAAGAQAPADGSDVSGAASAGAGGAGPDDPGRGAIRTGPGTAEPSSAEGGTVPDWTSEVEGLRRELATMRHELDELKRELGIG